MVDSTCNGTQDLLAWPYHSSERREELLTECRQERRKKKKERNRKKSVENIQRWRKMAPLHKVLYVSVRWLNFWILHQTLLDQVFGHSLSSLPLLYSLIPLYLFTLYRSKSVAIIPLRPHFSAGFKAKHFPYPSKKILSIQFCLLPATPHTENIFLFLAKPFPLQIFQPSLIAVSSKPSPPEKSWNKTYDGIHVLDVRVMPLMSVSCTNDKFGPRLLMEMITWDVSCAI